MRGVIFSAFSVSRLSQRTRTQLTTPILPLKSGHKREGLVPMEPGWNEGVGAGWVEGAAIRAKRSARPRGLGRIAIGRKWVPLIPARRRRRRRRRRARRPCRRTRRAARTARSRRPSPSPSLSNGTRARQHGTTTGSSIRACGPTRARSGRRRGTAAGAQRSRTPSPSPASTSAPSRGPPPSRA